MSSSDDDDSSADERRAGKADGEDEDASLVRARKRRIEAHEAQCRLRMWEVGVPLLAVGACIACMYACEDCLIGVMLFCAVLCFKDWVLVLVFITSLGLYMLRHPMGTNTIHHITNAAFEFVRTD